MTTTSLEEVWALFKETDRQLKEQARETDRQLRETDQQLKEQAREADRRFQDIEKMFAQLAQERIQDAKEAKERSKELDKRLGRLTNRLGEFVEGLIEPSVVRLFQSRGIDVHVVTRDVRADNPKLGLATQIDLFVVNSDTCILIEAKSHLSQEDIDEHVERMAKFKPLFPHYANMKVLGAVAGIVIADNAAKYAYRKGFFVITQQGDNAVILNDEAFQAKAW